jgi:hypothetical protein
VCFGSQLQQHPHVDVFIHMQKSYQFRTSCKPTLLVSTSGSLLQREPRLTLKLLSGWLLLRYYVAEGVRLYSQETWRRVMGTSGRAKVAEHIDKVR